ncbi:MAG: phage head morphogenesis protein [Bacteroidales bacterium]|nr:phage head morphogenesis protein [Bacteroidales bacterium]
MKNFIIDAFFRFAGNNRVYAEYYKRSSSPRKADYTKQAVDLHAKEIKDYTRAVMSATDPENPRRGDLMRFYQNMMMDLHLGSCIDNRILHVQCAPFKLVDASGNEDAEVHRLLEKPWFIELVRLVCLHTFEGTKLIEMLELNERMELKEVAEIPQSNFLPHKGVVIKEESDESGISYRDGLLKDYYFQVGSDWNLGLFSQLAIVVMAKKLGLGSWMGYIDKFGVPPVFAVTERLDTGRRDELFEMLSNFRQNQFLVLQGKESIVVPNNYQLDAHNTFESLIQIADAQISKRILGGTGLSDEKSFVGSAEVQERLLKLRNGVDKLVFKFYFNEEVKPRLVKLSPVYAPLDKLTLEWDESETLSLKEFIDAIGDFSAYYEFDIEEIKRITGLPVVKIKSMLGQSAKPEPDAGEKKKPESSVRLDYPAASAWDDTIDEIARLLHEGKLKPADLNSETVLKTYGRLSDGAAQGWGDGFFEYDAPKGQVSIQQQLRNSLFWFSGAKTYRQLEEINGMLLDGDGKVRPYHEFRRDVKLVSEKYNEAYLETEYGATLANAHAARDQQRFEAEKDIYPRLKVRTMEDENVRETHAVLNGVVRRVDDPKRIPPPFDWGCRCWEEQTAEPETAMPDIPVNPVFANNPGITGEAFTVLHPYFQMPKKELARVKSQTELTKLYAPYRKVDGAQVWVNHFADERDLPDNLQAARTLAKNHAVKVKIRPHIEAGREPVRNPEFYINGKTADLKRITGVNGFDSGFKTSKKQGCTVTVFRLDCQTFDAEATAQNLSRVYHPHRAVNQQPVIDEFYVIRGERSVKIKKDDVLSGKHKDMLEKLKG